MTLSNTTFHICTFFYRPLLKQFIVVLIKQILLAKYDVQYNKKVNVTLT